MSVVAPVMNPGVEFRVEIGVGTVGDPSTFVYDDAGSPGSRYDDEAVYGGGDITWAEVTSRGLSFKTNRGRDTWRDRFRAGSVTVTLDNDDGLFNPDYAGGGDGIGQLQLRVGRFLRVSARAKGDNEWLALFAGQIENIAERYNDAGFAIRSQFQAIDVMARLQSINPPALGTPVAAERSDLRVARILDAAGFDSDNYRLDVGKYSVQASTLADARLEEIQDTAQAEGGAFYIARDGAPTFRNRDWLTDGPNEASPQYWAGIGQGVEVVGVNAATWALGRVYNDVQFARVGGTAQRAQNPTSAAYYGERSYRLFDFQNTGDSAVLALAERFLERYSYDRLRLGSLRLIPTTPEALRLLLATEVGWRIRVTVALRGVSPSSWTYTQDVWVQRIQHYGSGNDYYCEVMVDNVDTGNPFLGGAYSVAFSTDFDYNENAGDTVDRLNTMRWPARSVTPATQARWTNPARLADWDVPRSFSVRALIDYYERGSVIKPLFAVWADNTADGLVRLRINAATDYRLDISDGSASLASVLPIASAPASGAFWLRADYDYDTGRVTWYTAPRAAGELSWTVALIDTGTVPAGYLQGRPPAGASILAVGDDFTGIARTLNGLDIAAVELWRDDVRAYRWTADSQAVRTVPGPQSYGSWDYELVTGVAPTIQPTTPSV